MEVERAGVKHITASLKSSAVIIALSVPRCRYITSQFTDTSPAASPNSVLVFSDSGTMIL